jgi:hypothetical protein
MDRDRFCWELLQAEARPLKPVTLASRRCVSAEGRTPTPQRRAVPRRASRFAVLRFGFTPAQDAHHQFEIFTGNECVPRSVDGATTRYRGR